MPCERGHKSTVPEVQQGLRCSRLGSGGRQEGAELSKVHVRLQVSSELSSTVSCAPQASLRLVQSTESSHRDVQGTLQESLSDSRGAQAPPRLTSPSPLLPTSLPWHHWGAHGDFPRVPTFLAIA